MLTELAGQLREHLAHDHQQLMERWTGEHLADHPDIAAALRTYSAGDRNLNRPLLAVVGYGAHLEEIGPEQLQPLGDLVFLPQVVRDFLAIHDDIVDGDAVKFDRPTLPAALGADAALFTADLLLGLVGDLIAHADVGEDSRYQLHQLTARVLRRTQQGQLTELALTHRDPATIPGDTLTRMYADKAAAYCYLFPFETGTLAAGHQLPNPDAVRRVLEDIGVASQIVDDLEGTLPGGDKHTPGEVLHLRRTVLLTHLADRLPEADPLRQVLVGTQANPEEAAALQVAFTTTGAAAATVATAAQLAQAADAQIPLLRIGRPARAYLHDLVQVRIYRALERLGQRS